MNKIRLTDLGAIVRRPFFLVFVALAAIQVIQFADAGNAADLVELGVLAVLGLAAVKERGQLAVAEGTRRTTPT